MTAVPRPRNNRPGRNAPAADAEPPPDPVAALSAPRRAALERALATLAGWQPTPGALGDLPQVTVPSDHIAAAGLACRDDAELDCRMLLCLACVDYQERFELVYFLQSLLKERTLVIKTAVPYAAPALPSVSGVWPAADWYEREAHDLFGVSFQGHPDLSPLLLYPEFDGFPGRRDYPFYEYREF